MDTKNQNQNQIKYNIDRSKNENENVIDEIPDVVSEMLVKEILKSFASDFNDPKNIVKLLEKMMNIDIDKEINEQTPVPCEILRTILVESVNKYTPGVPFWEFQSIIRIDNENLYINYEGSKYNKIEIITKSEYFKNKIDKVANFCDCKWNWRWGNYKGIEDHKLYKKTRPGMESWLDKCVKELLTENDKRGINIKNLLMIEFKRNI